MAALLAPGPKAQCRVDHLEIDGGRYAQTLTYPQRHGGPITVARAGRYDEDGFIGQATARSTTPRSQMSIVLDQQAVRARATC